MNRSLPPALLLCAFLLSACLESESGPPTTEDLLTSHTWNVLTCDISGPAVDGQMVIALDFRSGGMFILTPFDCHVSIGTWSLGEDGVTLRTTPGAPSEGDMETVWTILELTDTRLHLRAEQNDKGIVTEIVAE